MANATKHDLIASVSKFTGLTQADTRIVVEELLETISKYLEGDKTIEIRGFGTFYSKIRKPRPARNPKTGEVVPLQRRRVPLFKYSNELKKRISDELTGESKAAYADAPAPEVSPTPENPFQ